MKVIFRVIPPTSGNNSPVAAMSLCNVLTTKPEIYHLHPCTLKLHYTRYRITWKEGVQMMRDCQVHHRVWPCRKYSICEKFSHLFKLLWKQWYLLRILRVIKGQLSLPMTDLCTMTNAENKLFYSLLRSESQRIYPCEWTESMLGYFCWNTSSELGPDK